VKRLPPRIESPRRLARLQGSNPGGLSNFRSEGSNPGSAGSAAAGFALERPLAFFATVSPVR
jgi:hypothetical protein